MRETCRRCSTELQSCFVKDLWGLFFEQYSEQTEKIQTRGDQEDLSFWRCTSYSPSSPRGWQHSRRHRIPKTGGRGSPRFEESLCENCHDVARRRLARLNEVSTKSIQLE